MILSAYITLHKTNNGKWILETQGETQLLMAFNSIDEMATKLKELDQQDLLATEPQTYLEHDQD